MSRNHQEKARSRIHILPAGLRELWWMCRSPNGARHIVMARPRCLAYIKPECGAARFSKYEVIGL